MTAPGANDARRPAIPWYTRPAIVLPVVAALIIFSALMTPEISAGRSGDARLTSYSTAPQGARLFYDLVQRLGWSAAQRTGAAFTNDSSEIETLLDPVVPLRMTEVHALLDRVRQGSALLVALGPGTAILADSLQLTVTTSRMRVHPPPADRESCAPGPRIRSFLPTLWPGDAVELNTLAWTGPPPDGVTPITETDAAIPAELRNPKAAAVGFPYGRGRIVAAADPDLLRNDALRVCKYGLDIAAVRMLEYLRDGGSVPRSTVIFDEYRQGYGEQRGTMAAIAHYLVGVSSGRLFFQLLAAGLVLLLAAGPRALPPNDPERVERRSPLEHVDALGRAYAQVGATRSATARLVRGVRRRISGGAAPAAIDPSDDAFLARALRDAPALGPDVALIRRALTAPLSRRDFALVGAALERLELSLTRI